MSCGENGYEVGRERQSRLAGTDAERDWDWMCCDGITHHPTKRVRDIRCEKIGSPEKWAKVHPRSSDFNR